MANQHKYLGGGRKIGQSETEAKHIDLNYDPGNYYIAAAGQDKQRGSIRWEIGKSPYFLIARMQKWIDDPRTPYTCMADFARDAITHRDRQLEEFAADPNHNWGPWEEFHRRRKLEDEANALAGEVENYADNLNRAVALGDYVWIKDLVDSAIKIIPTLRPPYNERLQRIISSFEHNIVGLRERG